MKNFLLFVLSILLIFNFYSCKKEKENIEPIDNVIEEYDEPTEEEVVEFCRKYYKESSKVHAESLVIYNIDGLDDYYINHEVEKGPTKIDTSTIYVQSDDFELIDVEKVENNYVIEIDGYKENIKDCYYVKFKYNYKSLDNTSEWRQVEGGYSVYSYKNILKIAVDPSLTSLDICQSDIPIALKSLKEGKTIKFR